MRLFFIKMVLKINKDLLKNKSLYLFMRQCGYSPLKNLSFIKPLSTLGYPRFHIYIKEDSKNYFLKLHLDQRQVIYKGIKAHLGEYDGKKIKEEKQRIINILNKNG
jgi:hypothetical protein